MESSSATPQCKCKDGFLVNDDQNPTKTLTNEYSLDETKSCVSSFTSNYISHDLDNKQVTIGFGSDQSLPADKELIEKWMLRLEIDDFGREKKEIKLFDNILDEIKIEIISDEIKIDRVGSNNKITFLNLKPGTRYVVHVKPNPSSEIIKIPIMLPCTCDSENGVDHDKTGRPKSLEIRYVSWWKYSICPQSLYSHFIPWNLSFFFS